MKQLILLVLVFTFATPTFAQKQTHASDRPATPKDVYEIIHEGETNRSSGQRRRVRRPSRTIASTIPSTVATPTPTPAPTPLQVAPVTVNLPSTPIPVQVQGPVLHSVTPGMGWGAFLCVLLLAASLIVAALILRDAIRALVLPQAVPANVNANQPAAQAAAVPAAPQVIERHFTTREEIYFMPSEVEQPPTYFADNGSTLNVNINHAGKQSVGNGQRQPDLIIFEQNGHKSEARADESIGAER